MRLRSQEKLIRLRWRRVMLFWCAAAQPIYWNVPATIEHSTRRFRCHRQLAARHIGRGTPMRWRSFIWFTRGWKVEPGCSDQRVAT
jgi:hypothetical protein